MNVNTPVPSRELYNQVRAGFVSQGTSLSRWCGNNSISLQNAIHCLMGTWNGPKGQALRQKIVVDAGICGPSKAA